MHKHRFIPGSIYAGRTCWRQIAFFEASPQSLYFLIKNNFEELKKSLSSIKKEKKPLESEILFYKGKHEVINIISDIISKKQEILVYGQKNSPNTNSDTNFSSLFRKERIKAKIKLKKIIPEIYEKDFTKKSYMKITQIKINNNVPSSKSITFIYGNNVAHYTREKPIIGIIIRNKEIAEKERGIFNYFWKKSKSFNPKNLTKRAKENTNKI